jgi:hypothetical protein
MAQMKIAEHPGKLETAPGIDLDVVHPRPGRALPFVLDLTSVRVFDRANCRRLES